MSVAASPDGLLPSARGRHHNLLKVPPSARAGDTLALEELTCPAAHLSSMSSGANVISVRIDVHDRGSEVAKAVGVFGLPEGSPYRVEVLGN
jgi:hypothetical protein